MENYFFEDTGPLFIKKEVVAKINDLIKSEQKNKGEITFIFCSDKYLLEINKEYLQHDYYTDVITFDYSENNIISGDIFISIDRVKENADTYKVSFENELYRVMLHGVLHLVGYNDKTKEEQKIMRQKEDEYLNL